MEQLEQWILEAEEEIKEANFGDTDLTGIGELANKMQKVQILIAKLEGLLKLANQELRDIQWTQLPDAMAAANISTFKTNDGSEISIKDYLHCDIGKMNPWEKGSMFKWLIDHGEDEILKTNLNYSLGRGDLEKALAIKEAVEREFKVTAPVGHDVHWQTLDKWAKERVQKGEEVPDDIFKLNIGRQAKIKAAK